MKNTKVIACALSAAMLAGVFSGCSAKTTNITTEKFVNACDKSLKFDEVDLNDIDRLDMGDLEDGIYFTMEQEDIEDMGLDSYLDMYLSSIGLDDVFEAEDIESFAVAGQMTGADDVEDIEEPEDVSDLEIEGAYALQITLADDDKAADLMEFLSDALDEVDIDTAKDLSKKEFYSGKKDGYLRFHIEVAKLVEIVMDNDDFQDMLEDSDMEDEITEMLESLSGDAVVSVEISGANILVVVGFSLNTEPSILKSFTKAFGMSTDLTKLPTNQKVTEGVVEGVGDAIAQYLERATAAAEEIRRHNEEVAAVESQIDEALNNTDWDD